MAVRQVARKPLGLERRAQDQRALRVCDEGDAKRCRGRAVLRAAARAAALRLLQVRRPRRLALLRARRGHSTARRLRRAAAAAAATRAALRRWQQQGHHVVNLRGQSLAALDKGIKRASLVSARE